MVGSSLFTLFLLHSSATLHHDAVSLVLVVAVITVESIVVLKKILESCLLMIPQRP
jgi:hypothetical protein